MVRAGLKFMRWCVGLAAAAILPAATQAANATYAALLAPNNGLQAFVVKDQAALFSVAPAAFNPNGTRIDSPKPHAPAALPLELNVPFPIDGNAAHNLTLGCRAEAHEEGVIFAYTVATDRDTSLGSLTLSINPAAGAVSQVMVLAEGKETALPMPPKQGGDIRNVSRLTFRTKEAGDVVANVEPPVTLSPQISELRLILAAGSLKAGRYSFNVVVKAATTMALLATSEQLQPFEKRVDTPDWFLFSPKGGDAPSVIGMEDWLERPAGKHGGVRMIGDHFEFQDGTRIQFWGTNLGNLACAPSRQNADTTALRFARYGVNGVRLHKFTGPGWEGIGDANDATKFDAKKLEDFDYFTSQLQARGIYYGFSHSYHFRLRPGDKTRIAGYDEIMKNFNGDTYALINFAGDVQDLMIQMVVNLLQHKNPHTGKTYAEDPALSYVEMQNEDDLFFYTSAPALHGSPTYTRQVTERFNAWLRAKYGTQEKLKAAWNEGLGSGESLAPGNIPVEANPWFFSDDNLPKQSPGRRQRLLDNAAFFHELQNAFYDKFARAIRATGYKGPLVGSPWQAPTTVPHYYNLRSDYLAGYIDRHDYFGGGIEGSMLGHPDRGLLATGMQQVIDRPFGLSEWITEYPDLYATEDPAVIAAYGLGLQAWSASYEFASDSGQSGAGFAKDAGHLPWGLWNVDVPAQMGQYPALARMIYRGDVKHGEVLSVRKVSLQDLAGGKVDLGGTLSPEALAAGRCVLQFTQGREASTFPDMTKYKDGTTIISSTEQLKWSESAKGFITINTAGTKGVVGFAENQPQQLGDVRITSQSPYASILLTAIEKLATLAEGKSALITAVSRNANKGFTYFTLDQSLLSNGEPAVMIEPVKATVHFTRNVEEVNILDQDGRRMGRMLPVTGNDVQLDTGRDRAIYYEVVFGR